MLYAFMKQLIVDGGGKFTVCRIGAESEEALNVKRDMYLADDWQEATEDEYKSQFEAIGDPDNVVPDEAPEAEQAEAPAEKPEPTVVPDAEG